MRTWRARTWSSTPPGCRKVSSPTAWRCSPRTFPSCETWHFTSGATAPTRSSSRPPIPSTRSTTPPGKAGGFDRHQVIGYSINDSFRFREMVAKAKGVKVAQVEATVIGEHGSTQVLLVQFGAHRRPAGVFQRGGEAGDPSGDTQHPEALRGAAVRPDRRLDKRDRAGGARLAQSCRTRVRSSPARWSSTVSTAGGA